MTKLILTVVIVVGLSLGAYHLHQYWGNYKTTDAAPPASAPQNTSGDDLPGLPDILNQTYQTARQRGVTGLHDFLNAYGTAVSDPRLASIQLDYAILVASSNPGEARRVYGLVKNRIEPDSPVYSRVQQLAKSYE
jgi:hypothetical protein